MKCKHPSCKCSGPEVGSDGFCSDHCRKQQSAVSDGKCGCGHRACS